MGAPCEGWWWKFFGSLALWEGCSGLLRVAYCALTPALSRSAGLKAQGPRLAGLGFNLQVGDLLALLDQLGQRLFGLGQLGALLVEHFGRGLGDEAFVGQLAADSLDLALQAL